MRLSTLHPARSLDLYTPRTPHSTLRSWEGIIIMLLTKQISGCTHWSTNRRVCVNSMTQNFPMGCSPMAFYVTYWQGM